MIVIICGINGGGKTTLAQKYIDDGYYRVNRDELGGKLKDLHQFVIDAHQQGHTKFVLDNTFRDVEARRPIIETAEKLGLPIKCVWLNTSLEEAQVNACTRMLLRAGKLLGPDDFKKTKDPNLFPPAALFGYRKEFEKPTLSEGFESIEEVPFVRSRGSDYCNKALILDFDDTLRVSKGPEGYPCNTDEIEMLPGRSEKIQYYRDKGYVIAGVSNQSGIEKGKLSLQAAIDCFNYTCDQLKQEIDYLFCPHASFPVKCFCRKPHPGNGVVLIEKYKLDPSQCVFVGDQTSDKTFSERCGFQYQHPDQFFADT